MRLCQEAIERGVFAQAIRPPTVPSGTSRLRLTTMTSHTPAELRMAAGVFGNLARKLGLDPASMTPPPIERRIATETAPDEFAAFARGTSYEAAEAAAAVPFDLERDGGRSREPVPAMTGSSAPFDLEREISSARAA